MSLQCNECFNRIDITRLVYGIRYYVKWGIIFMSIRPLQYDEVEIMKRTLRYWTVYFLV